MTYLPEPSVSMPCDLKYSGMESQSAPTPSSRKWSIKFQTRVVSGRLPDMKLPPHARLTEREEDRGMCCAPVAGRRAEGVLHVGALEHEPGRGEVVHVGRVRQAEVERADGGPHIVHCSAAELAQHVEQRREQRERVAGKGPHAPAMKSTFLGTSAAAAAAAVASRAAAENLMSAPDLSVSPSAAENGVGSRPSSAAGDAHLK